MLIDSGCGYTWTDEDVVIEGCNVMLIIIKTGDFEAVINDFHIEL